MHPRLLASYDPLNQSPPQPLDLCGYRYICLTPYCFLADHKQFFKLTSDTIIGTQLVPGANQTFKIVVNTYTPSGDGESKGTNRDLNFHLPHNMSQNQERLKPIVEFFLIDERFISPTELTQTIFFSVHFSIEL